MDDSLSAPTRALSRRRFLQLSAAALAASVLPQLEAQAAHTALSPGPAGDVALGWMRRMASVNASRAVLAYRSQQAHFYRPLSIPGDKTSLYLEQTPQGDAKPFAFVWPFSQATAASLDLLGLSTRHGDFRPDVQDRLYRGLPQYWNGRGYQPCPSQLLDNSGVWYDDNAWVGLDLVRAYRLAGDQDALARARQVFDYITTGWCTGAGHVAPGGLYWVQGNENRHRNTCSNAPSAELGLRLHQLTGEVSYLDWAKRFYAWVNGTLLGEDGLYWDHIEPDGRIDRTRRSYNQGSMIGAGALLYSITGEAAYLNQALETAGAALSYYGETAFAGQAPAFNAIFFRNLLHLAAVDATYLSATLRSMQIYADRQWTKAQSPGALFAFPLPPSQAAAPRTHKLLHQAGMVQIYACLAWDPERYDLLV